VESRRIPGEGIQHEENWIEERLEDASDVDEFAAASQKLQQEARDLRNLTAGQGNQGPTSPNDPLVAEANLPVDRMQGRQGAGLDASASSQLDPNVLPPEAEARSVTTERLTPGTGS
jgi:hypothetical protein